MPLSKNLSAYAHVKKVLDAALPHEQVIWSFPSNKAAIRGRQEAYYFRKLSNNPLYDEFILRIEDKNVIIERRTSVGTLTTPDGTEIKPAEPDISGFESAAAELAKTLGLQSNDDQDT